MAIVCGKCGGDIALETYTDEPTGVIEPHATCAECGQEYKLWKG